MDSSTKAGAFPAIDHLSLAACLCRPQSKPDVILDTDTYNEIDDQFALAYLINAHKECNVKAICAAPFYSPPDSGRVYRSQSPEDGMELSYNEIKKVLRLMGREDLFPIVYRGSRFYLPDEATPAESSAAEAIIDLSTSYSADNPLYVIAIGAITNVASALLIDPTLRERVMVIWLGGHAHHWGNCTDFNMVQDIAAARVVFGCGVPLVQVPCLGVTSEFRFTKPELEHLFRGKNALCDYLLDNTYQYMAQKTHLAQWSKPLWDVAAVAWVLGGDFALQRIVPSPIPQQDFSYGLDPNRHPMLYVYHIKKDELTEDLVKKLIN